MTSEDLRLVATLKGLPVHQAIARRALYVWGIIQWCAVAVRLTVWDLLGTLT